MIVPQSLMKRGKFVNHPFAEISKEHESSISGCWLSRPSSTENGIWGAHPPRVLLDAPRVQSFCGHVGEVLATSGAFVVFREGAENGTRGACAPQLKPVFGQCIAEGFSMLQIWSADDHRFDLRSILNFLKNIATFERTP
jgi:hypothetical protein